MWGLWLICVVITQLVTPATRQSSGLQSLVAGSVLRHWMLSFQSLTYYTCEHLEHWIKLTERKQNIKMKWHEIGYKLLPLQLDISGFENGFPKFFKIYDKHLSLNCKVFKVRRWISELAMIAKGCWESRAVSCYQKYFQQTKEWTFVSDFFYNCMKRSRRHCYFLVNAGACFS